MMYKDNRSWPAAWLWTIGYDNTHPLGELGILKAVLRSHIEPHGPMFFDDGTLRSGILWCVIGE
jgi:hypothetical protein